MASATELPKDDAPSVDVPKDRKTFIPLENNPEVMTALVHNLGLSKDLAFHDVFSIDDADLLAFLPRPALALLLVFPINDAYETFRREEDADRLDYQGRGPEEDVMWFKQTIRNACGMMALLHGVANGEARNAVGEASALAALLKSAVPLAPVERAELLYNSPALEAAHQAAASRGDSTAPPADESIDLHYVCFVKGRNGHLWELDGRRKGPLDRGQLNPGDDVLSEKALDLGVRSFLKREAATGGGELRFSLVALAPTLE
ncbi:MAG: hypothetical protein M1825_003159 [Sarcosagium campestre]|nr:MAG: hypothetical protein M1825_003159 [Sarcosagium campestre]